MERVRVLVLSLKPEIMYFFFLQMLLLVWWFVGAIRGEESVARRNLVEGLSTMDDGAQAEDEDVRGRSRGWRKSGWSSGRVIVAGEISVSI